MPKVYLDRLKSRYGWTGGKYRALMARIIGENHESVARAVGRVKVGRLREEGQRLAKRKKPVAMKVPALEEVLPKRSVFIRKGAEQGKLLADSLRTKLSGDLRDTVAEFLREGKGAMQYQIGERRGRIKPELIERMQRRLKNSFQGYTKTDPSIGVPPNIRAIAVTETRSAIDDIKAEFARRMLEKNPGAKAQKRWKHNDHLVEDPRPGHMELNGKVLDLKAAFEVRQFRKEKGIWIPTGATVRMDHPHASGAPPEEVINCQCEVDYIFDIPEAT